MVVSKNNKIIHSFININSLRGPSRVMYYVLLFEELVLKFSSTPINLGDVLYVFDAARNVFSDADK